MPGPEQGFAMNPIHTFSVVPSLPPVLEPMRRIAYNLRWAWDHDAIELFRRLDSDLWETVGHNPVSLLGAVEQRKLEAAARNDSFLAHMDRVARELGAYLSSESTWCRRTHGEQDIRQIAYFSAEFGLTECLSIFAGGLGILAGDHLKSASDLGVPIVGVGLLYQQGYFRQYLNDAGWQQESYLDNDFHNLPLTLVRKPDGGVLTVSVEYPGRAVTAQVWRVDVGRAPLYLLDTNIPENPRKEDRDVTDQLYGGDLEMRLRQEILLGIGGYRVLEALGIEPDVFHMNEGHSAFLALERVRRLMAARGLSFAEARELASCGLVFTGHTPVMAGHDFFPPQLIERYFTEYAAALRLDRRDFLGLGRKNPHDESEDFCMTVLAQRTAAFQNAVSRLHGKVSREMWQSLWPGVPQDEIPINHVTNGVHFRSWISNDMNQLFDRYLSPGWREEPGDKALWKRAETIPAEELWRNHERRRERMVAFARRRLRAQLERRGASNNEVQGAEEVLDPDVLTIGFARRFATYKRATLLLRDPDRLARILNDTARPVQIIYAGKAHPRDDAGKAFIQRIAVLARQPQFRRRLVFLEEYDMAASRYLVQGVDVWLNTPLRPMEASGTSGMKAAANGALNLSTLDGWWDEAWNDAESHLIGWAIGRGETYANQDMQDELEAQALYGLLERDVVPAFYQRGPDRLPRQWIERMKASLAGLCYQFNTHRMVQEYTERFYVPAQRKFQELGAEDARRARQLAAWKDRVTKGWPEVRVVSVENHSPATLAVGQPIKARVRVHLGALSPEEVAVELYYGRVNASGQIVNAMATPMKLSGPGEGGDYPFEAEPVAPSDSGLHGYTIRVLPHNPDLPLGLIPGLITWAHL
ncbi:MAG: alpha-glucan family phosphorylase [Bryobacterales bacterium]|nr:alpha-glucan family phosphorylase [Bryobacterales bacterium]